MNRDFQVPQTSEEVLQTYNFAVLHLRQQFRFKRIGLAIGAGVSMPLDYPSWEGLVKGIAENESFSKNILPSLPKSSITTTTQRLYEYFQECNPLQLDENERLHSERIANHWKRILSECLYKDNLGEEKDRKLENHPYMTSMLPVVERSNLIVNFNLDDSIEHALDLRNRKKGFNERRTRVYETRWELNAPIRNDIPTIFHPNGYISARQHEYSSDSVVFADDSFLKRMTLGKMADDSVLLSEYINNTYIHIGLSLKDEVLKALLQRSWKSAPANVHYQIHFSRTGSIDGDVHKSILDANFRVLNLSTLFLGTDGTKSLFDLVTMDQAEFRHLSRKLGIGTKRTLYITGSVGAGKTTIVNHFKNFWAHDEWIDPSPDVVSKPFDSLTDGERIQADNWIGDQFSKKNRRLLDEAEFVAIVDRCPLDPLTFSTDGYASRAASLKAQISPGQANYSLEPGSVFVLEGEPYELRVRLIRKWKFWSEDTIGKLIKSIKAFYNDRPTYIDTKGLSPEEVVRTISRKVFFEPYDPLDLNEILEQAIEGDTASGT